MKRIFTLASLWLFTNSVNGQIDYFLPQSRSAAVKPPPSIEPIAQKRVTFTCHATVSADSKEPLVVIDGVPCDYNDLKKLNLNEIASIDIFRDTWPTIFCRRSNGVIIITTKSANICTLTIKDFLTGRPIPRATVCITNGNDSNRVLASDSGVVFIDKLKYRGYRVTASSTGYVTASLAIGGKEQDLLLQRDVKICDEVAVKAFSWVSCILRGCFPGTLKKEIQYFGQRSNSKENYLFRVYPNPVKRNNRVNIEWVSNDNGFGQLTVFDMSGTAVFTQPEKISTGQNQISVVADGRWAAGIYNIQLRNEKGTLVRQEKIIVQ